MVFIPYPRCYCTGEGATGDFGVALKSYDPLPRNALSFSPPTPRVTVRRLPLIGSSGSSSTSGSVVSASTASSTKEFEVERRRLRLLKIQEDTLVGRNCTQPSLNMSIFIYRKYVNLEKK